MKGLKLELYRDYFLSIKRGRGFGIISNAKPIFVLSLLSHPKLSSKNIILLDDQILTDLYRRLSIEYRQYNISPILLPFFHLRTSPFYELVWKNEVPNTKLSHTPSAKFLRQNLSHAKLDDDLWEVLQSSENREYLRKCIIDTYLKH